MDPTEIQEDKSNDTHSLESGGDTEKKPAAPAADEAAKDKPAEDGVVDATGGESGIPAKPSSDKESFIKRLWHKFNIYLLLFILIIILSIGLLVYTTIKGKQTVVTSLTSQGLSESTLKQLANTDVTVGGNKQILTVQSNAIFAGAVLARSSLDVAGSLKVGGNLSISDLNVSGATQLGDATTNNLTVNGAFNLQGALTLKNGLNVSGASNFAGSVTMAQLSTGSLQLNGDLNLTHHITAGGTIPGVAKGTAVGGGGTASLSGSDTSGSVIVNTGSSPPAGCFATITFSQKFASTPHVVVTPVGAAAAGLQYYITRSTTEFVICSASSAPSGQTFGFDYVVLD